MKREKKQQHENMLG